MPLLKLIFVIFIFSKLLVKADTPTVIDAAEQAYRRADAELIVASKKLSAQFSDKITRKEFDRAQAAWKQFRDTEARFRATLSAQGGSAYTTDFLSSLTDITIERTRQIQEWIQSK